MASRGRSLAVGTVIGAGTVIVLGMALGLTQPAERPSVEARLDRLERAMLKPESTLPEDPERSIESMLEEILVSTKRSEAMLAGLDEARIEELAARVRFVHNSLLTVKVGQIVDLERRVRDIERQFQGLGSTTRLDDIVRRVDQMERDQDRAQRTADDNQRRLDRTLSDVQRLDRRVSRVESRIR